MSLQHRERIDVAREVTDEQAAESDRETFEEDGQHYEEIEVWNYLNVTLAHQVRGGNPTHETFYGSSRIEAGGGGPQPDFVTEWVAEELWHEHSIDLPTDEFDIEVIDVTADDVHQL
jgi:hypothetical protein